MKTSKVILRRMYRIKLNFYPIEVPLSRISFNKLPLSNTASGMSKNSFEIIHNSNWHKVIILLIAILLYVNTLGHDYAQDDTLVITENSFVNQGVSGIGGILSKDSFYGFFQDGSKSNLVSGGRYRPLSLITFAIENEIFGQNPMISHAINVILYAMTGYFLYLLMVMLCAKVNLPSETGFLGFIITLVFILHPVHTEVVANIKGRDEILSLLFSICGILVIVKSNVKTSHYLLSGLFFFLALMSKETPITLLPVLFFLCWRYDQSSFKVSLQKTLPLMAAGVAFIAIRWQVLGWSLGIEPMEMMNNPFVKYENGAYAFFTSGERWATIIAAYGEYLRLLFFPFELTNDYYPRYLDVLNFGDPKVIISLVAFIITTFGLFYCFGKNKFLFIALLWFGAGLTIVSNVFFPIGTHLSERFLYLPSVGFSMGVGYGLYYLYYKKLSYVFYTLAILLAVFFTWKTVTRNMVWENNFTLYTTDVLTSNNSAKALNAAAGSLVEEAQTLDNNGRGSGMYVKAKGYIDKAVQIHPNYKNAWLIKGNVEYYLDNFEASLNAYENALRIDPYYQDARTNGALIMRLIGRELGEKQNDLVGARRMFQKSYEFNPQDPETVRLQGIVEGISGNHQEAVKYFERFANLTPNSPAGYVLLSKSYAEMGLMEQAMAARQKALSIDPNAYNE